MLSDNWMSSVLVVAGLPGPHVNIWGHSLGVTHASHTDSHTRHLRIPGTNIQVNVHGIAHRCSDLLSRK